MQGSEFFNIVLLGLLAGFIAFRLYSVLGRRTGNERSRDDQLRMPDGAETNPKPAASKDNVVTLPTPVGASPAAANPQTRALMDIKLVDRTFDSDRFLSGARSAYEMIVTAFAREPRSEKGTRRFHLFEAQGRAHQRSGAQGPDGGRHCHFRKRSDDGRL